MTVYLNVLPQEFFWDVLSVSSCGLLASSSCPSKLPRALPLREALLYCLSDLAAPLCACITVQTSIKKSLYLIT